MFFMAKAEFWIMEVYVYLSIFFLQGFPIGFTAAAATGETFSTRGAASLIVDDVGLAMDCGSGAAPESPADAVGTGFGAVCGSACSRVANWMTAGCSVSGSAPGLSTTPVSTTTLTVNNPAIIQIHFDPDEFSVGAGILAMPGASCLLRSASDFFSASRINDIGDWPRSVIAGQPRSVVTGQ